MTTLRCWWHRAVLRHRQESIINGANEPGVICFCPPRPWRQRWYGPKRWFPSDGGRGR